MAHFASLAELEVFLHKLYPEYAQYASVLWQHQVRMVDHLANASKSLLLSWGLLELHVDDIKTRAGSTGEHSAYNGTHLPQVNRQLSFICHAGFVYYWQPRCKCLL